MSPRPNRRFHLGTATTIAAGTLAVTAVVAAGLSSFGAFSGMLTAHRVMLAAPSSAELGASLMRVGITADTLAAAGCSAEDASGVGVNTVAHLDATAFGALTTADTDVREADAEAARLGRLVRGGQATQEDLDAYGVAMASLESAEAAREAHLNALFVAAVDDLPTAATELLENMQANTRPVPLQYTVNDRTDAEWTQLRDALASIKASAMCDEEPDAGCKALVASCNAETEVATAASNLDNNLDEIRSAMHSALGYE